LRLTDGEFLNDNMVDLQIKRVVIWKKYYDSHPHEFQNMSEDELRAHFDLNFVKRLIDSTTKAATETSREEGGTESPLTSTESDHNTSSLYAFNSMFYQKLTETKRSESYDLVKKWTKNVDLFSKEFIFVPINLGSHWSLLCIVRPGLERPEVTVALRSVLFDDLCLRCLSQNFPGVERKGNQQLLRSQILTTQKSWK
jgi:Ulp1 family protease